MGSDETVPPDVTGPGQDGEPSSADAGTGAEASGSGEETKPETEEPEPSEPAKPIESKLVQILSAIWLPIAFVLVWIYNLDISSRAKNFIFIAIVVFVAIGVLAGIAWAQRNRTAVARVTAFVILALVVSAAALIPVIFLGPNERILFLKLGAIFFLSLLPGLLYLQFIAVKAESLRDEFVLYLHRLQIDRQENLPPYPPGHESDNLYLRKFDALYGGPITTSDGKVIRRTGGNLVPVVLATVLLAVGWALVLQPEPLTGPRLTLEGLTLSGRPILPVDALRFGFAGAYFFILEMLTRRYFQDDLKTSAYINASSRIVSVALLVTAVHQVWPGSWSAEQENAFAFMVGVFPQVGLKALQSLLARGLAWLIPNLRKRHPLSDLDGMNIWYESRLLEGGVEDMQNLATANLVDVILRTRVPVDRLVDWVDQAHLYVRVSDGKVTDAAGNETTDRQILRRLGIRTATDLEDAFRPSFRPGPGGERQPDPVEEPADFSEKLRAALNRGDQVLPSVTRSILKTLAREPNLYHVRRWKSFSWEVERAKNARARQSRSQAARAASARSVLLPEAETKVDVPVVTAEAGTAGDGNSGPSPRG